MGNYWTCETWPSVPIQLQEAFNPIQSLEYHLVARVELDSRLLIDAIGVEFGTQSASWSTAIALRLPSTADVALSKISRWL